MRKGPSFNIKFPRQGFTFTFKLTCSAMTPLPFLPNEIWFYIADFLEVDNRLLRRIIGMNRSFFELAMDKLYHKFSLTRTDPVLLEKSIEQLL